MKLLSKEFIDEKKRELFRDESKWKLFQSACVFSLLGLTSLIMSVVNLLTRQGSFTWVTLGFGIACAIDLLLLSRKGTVAKVAMGLFAVELTGLFFYFIITGIPDGFSVLWTAMLPTFGLLMFGMRNGTVLSLIMLAVLCFFFWIPFGQGLLLYRYSPTFLMRFPLLYIAFFIAALLLERMRETAYLALKESREKYEFLCYHDAMTGLYNRFWFHSIVSDSEKHHIQTAAVAILDIDNFKFINDNFGHPNGDIVIKELGQTIGDTLRGSGELCRWGGDEFLILFHTDIDADTVCKRIVDEVRSKVFVFDGERFGTTLSVGIVLSQNGSTDDIRSLIHQADINLYRAKDEGKNCMISSRLEV